MLAKFLPVIVIVVSNAVYNICAKSSPAEISPFASLTVTYLVGAVTSAALYFLLTRGGNLLGEVRQLNWTSFLLGVSIVGLEGGFLYLYKAGWEISVGQLVTSALLSVVLLVIGRLFYHEAIHWQKIVGVVLCMAGLYFLG